VIEERVSETRFGLDTHDGEDVLDTLAEWDDLSWGHFPLPASRYISEQGPPTPPETEYDSDGTTIDIQWDTHAAIRAWITLQKPVRIAVHGDDMLPEKETGE
jgi:hypothetical protein